MFDQLSDTTRAAVINFQEYLGECVTNAVGSWGSAKRLIQKAASELAAEIARPNSPVRPQDLAELLQIEVRCGIHSLPARGALVPEAGRLVLFLKAESVWLAPRFTVAHELGHVLFFRPNRGGVARLVPVRSVGSAESVREEALCDDFARALLVPDQSDYLRWALESEASVGLMLSLSHKAEIDPRVLLRRVMHDANGWPDCVFYEIDVRRHRVTVFRGSRMRSKRSVSTGPELKEYVEFGRYDQPIMYLRHLRQEGSPLAAADIVATSSRIWARVPGTSRGTEFLPI